MPRLVSKLKTMKKLNFIPFLLLAVFLSSCVSQKKYTAALNQTEALETKLNNCNDALKESNNERLVLESDLSNERNKSQNLTQQMEYFKSTNTNLLDQLSVLSVVSKSGAESIKKSLEALNEQNKYIKDLTSSMQRKDSINLALVMNLKRSLDNFDDEDISIEVKKGVVYVSISDKMLFKSGSYKVSAQAEGVLGKIAKIINDHKELDILVEGHTDNVPISTDCMTDNWDLSAKRATSIVRLMQTKFEVDPARMTAGGRSEFVPKTTNQTAKGKAINRRTEIIILPKLDQFFKLLEPPTGK
jgi:chemotaxis protein MotB